MEQADPLIVAIMHQLLELSLCYLEKSEFNQDDFTIQVCGLSGILTLEVYFLFHIYCFVVIDECYSSSISAS